MTELSMALKELLSKYDLAEDEAFLREGVRYLAQQIMELEVSEQIGAQKHERSPERKTQRNGYRERPWDTRVGSLTLDVPKLRQGSYFPSLLQPRRRSEKALLAVIQAAYVEGVSTRKVEEVLEGLGLTHVNKNQVSRICKELDELVRTFRERALEDRYIYLWLDAVYVKVRMNQRIVSRAVVIAIGVRETGEREVLGFDIGTSEDQAFWQAFLRQLVKRGLRGVQLVISDAHEGLKGAIAQVLHGATWQRCRVHFMRNLLALIPHGDKSMVAAAVRTIFTQRDRPAAGQQLVEVVRVMQGRWPKAASLLQAAEDDVLAYMAFPQEHWTRLYSTNVLERLNREIRRRTDVVAIFPNDASGIRLIGALLIEVHEEWAVERRYFSLESMQRLLAPELFTAATTEPLRLAPVR